jgi:hypothetical protein
MLSGTAMSFVKEEGGRRKTEGRVQKAEYRIQNTEYRRWRFLRAGGAKLLIGSQGVG